MKRTPTTEQQAILDAFPKHDILKINAVAGAGKTSTLQMLAEANNLNSLYVCFNKANAVEASERFPSHIACRTMHSLAFSAFGRPLMHKLQAKFNASEPYVNKARSNKEIAALYGIPDLNTSADTVVTQRATAGLVKMTVGRFQNSASKDLDYYHVPKHEILQIAKNHPDLDLEKYRNVVINFAKKLWADRIDPLSPVQAEHDTYLKLWQLSEPVLHYDVIYVDEAQDTNPVALDILEKQKHCKMVYVGDSYQSIYGFRMAINAMDTITAPTYILSKSFRYGKEVADLATFIIRDAIHVKGLETIDSKLVKHITGKYTMIFRTNAYLIQTAVGMIAKGMKVFANIDTRKFENQLVSVLALFEKRPKDIKDDDISLYSTWEELLEAADEKLELKRLAAIVESGQTNKFLYAVTQVKKNKDSYDVLLTTAHKSKGMEWDKVVLADDYMEKIVFADKNDGRYFNQQEINLFYVALTRAIKELQIPPEFLKRYHMAQRNAFSFDFDEDYFLPERSTLEVGSVGLYHVDKHTSSDVIKNMLGGKLHSDLMTVVEEGVGVRLPNGDLTFFGEDAVEEELRAQYSFGG